MLLHKSVQTSPAKAKRPVQFLASRGPIGSLGTLPERRAGKLLGKTYVRGVRGGLIQMPEGLVTSLTKLQEGARRAQRVRVVMVLLLLVLFTAVSWLTVM